MNVERGRAAPRIPFYRRLTFRLGVVISVALIVVDVSTIPLWNWLYFYLSPEWFDPDFLREYAAFLEQPKEEWAAADVARFNSPLDLRDRAIIYGTIVGYTIVFASIFGFFISRFATARIRRLAEQVDERDALASGVPGPFDVGGSDEIQRLATTMNDMRARILSLLEDLEERDRLRVEWVSGVSHDLRAPLTALAAALDRSRRSIPALVAGGDADALDRSLAAAELDVRRVLDLAEDLLEIARLEAGGELVVEPVPAGELLRTTVQSLQPLADERGLELTLDFPPGLPELRADGHRLIRALENIVVNSLQHARRAVGVSAEHLGSTLEIAVRDDGDGLPEVEGRVVLDDLGPDRRRADSNGLGLEVARRIVAAHEGTLIGENPAGGGACIRIVLPL